MGIVLLFVLLTAIGFILCHYMSYSDAMHIITLGLCAIVVACIVGIGLTYLTMPLALAEIQSEYESIGYRLENKTDLFIWKEYTKFAANIASYQAGHNNWWISWFYPIDVSPYVFNIIGLTIVK